jgi:phosphoglycerate dehydrogenase-like enzyme
MKPRLVFSAPYAFLSESLLGRLRDRFDVEFVYRQPLALQIERLADARVWVVSTAPERYLGSDVFDRCPKLEVVATPSTGVTHLDPDCLRRRGVQLLTIRDSPVIEQIRASSEFTLTLLLALVRKLPAALREAREGHWRENEAALRGNELYGKTLGVVGYGRIGRNMCEYGHALGMHTLANDPYRHDCAPHTRLVGLEELLVEADVVCMCVHLSPETRDFFGRSHFAAMKCGSWFVNTSRGEVIDEDALVEALESGRLAGAAVDVLRDEQGSSVNRSVLRRYASTHDNLIVSPHVAGLTVESESKAAGEIVRQLLEFYS